MRDWLALYLEEDLGSGDITTQSLFAAADWGTAHIVAKERALVAGSKHAAEIFQRLGAKAEACVADGVWAEAGAQILSIVGPVAGILAGERVALNLLSRMSGIASQVRELAEQLAKECAPAVITGTRKTTPGFRFFEKEAIRIGGGNPHRMGLFDAAMVKDNHIAVAGSVAEAVRRVKAAHPDKRLTCEVESFQAARDAAAAGADWLLIDNQSPDVGRQWAQQLWEEYPNLGIEASGGITPDNVLAYGWADRVSLGWLTQKAQGKDFSLEMEEKRRQEPTHE